MVTKARSFHHDHSAPKKQVFSTYAEGFELRWMGDSLLEISKPDKTAIIFGYTSCDPQFRVDLLQSLVGPAIYQDVLSCNERGPFGSQPNNGIRHLPRFAYAFHRRF